MRARAEKEIREREQLALYGGLAAAGGEQSGVNGSKGELELPKGFSGVVQRILRSLIIYPDDTFRAVWDLVIAV